MRERSVERGPSRRAISHIDFERRRAAADRLRERQRRGEIEVGDRHSHAGGRQRPHDRRADASRASRDDRAASLQIEFAAHAVLSVCGFRFSWPASGFKL